MISTVKEVLAENKMPPSTFKEWHNFVGSIDGYKLAEELGLGDLNAWGSNKLNELKINSNWDLDILHARILLFYISRRLHFTGYTYHEFDKEIDHILQDLAKKYKTTYTSLS